MSTKQLNMVKNSLNGISSISGTAERKNELSGSFSSKEEERNRLTSQALTTT
jgi:hypothetical protein